MHVIMLGPPGSGKGTMAGELSRRFQITHISTGDIFRKNIKEQTALGLEAKGFIDKGLLVPDSVTIAMVADRIAQQDCSTGYLLDGFPRTLDQAKALSEHLSGCGEKIDIVVNLELPDALVVERLSSRRVCGGCGRGYHTVDLPPITEGICDACGSQLIQRDDDKPETILRRLKAYHESTAPLIDFYTQEGILFSVVNDGPVGSNYARVISEISKRTGIEE